jgi:YggT family protein
MASADIDPTPTRSSTKALLPTAFPRLPIIPKIKTPKVSPQRAAQGCQDLQKLFGSAIAECIQTIERSFKAIVVDNPFFQRLIFLSKQNPYQTICQGHCQTRKRISPLSSCNFAAILPGDAVAGLVVTNGILNFLNIYNTLLIARLVLTWFPNSPPIIVNPLSTLCDPYLNIFRGIIPPLGGTLDLSPILAFFLLNAVTSAASALPAELPKGAESKGGLASMPSQYSKLSTQQKLWLKRQSSSCDVQEKENESK